MYDFQVVGSEGIELVKAVSQEWALSFYKVLHGEDCETWKVELL